MTEQKTKTMKQLIKKLLKFQKEHLMKEKVAEGLITQNPRTLTCYTKPKILKEGISENPVISSINCLNLKKLE